MHKRKSSYFLNAANFSRLRVFPLDRRDIVSPPPVRRLATKRFFFSAPYEWRLFRKGLSSQGTKCRASLSCSSSPLILLDTRNMTKGFGPCARISIFSPVCFSLRKIEPCVYFCGSSRKRRGGLRRVPGLRFEYLFFFFFLHLDVRVAPFLFR